MEDLIKLIGKKGMISVRGLNVEVTITGVKKSYGRNRYKVTPLSGNGKVWVEIIKIL